jgi:predicted nucleotidyltransferase component of viral defense system
MLATGRQRNVERMKLFEHPDFEQAILQAAEHHRDQGLRPAIIEKDYYVTEALRALSEYAANKIIFKGGTSLLKGWNLIGRFSEDIDIFLDPLAFQPALGKNAIDRELKRLRDTVSAHPALTFVEQESQTIGGFGRNDRFSYVQHFGGPGEVTPRVLLEAGTASGREPTTTVELRSYLAEFLAARGMSMGTDDQGSFPMRLLHFRRTFVEKLFAIHSKVEVLKRDGRPIGTYARHYYDLFQLAAQPEVTAMLNSAEYAEIKNDYDQISRVHFPKSYFFPEAMRFSMSDALFPPATLAAALGAEYEAQCQMLCYGPYPSWSEVQARFLLVRDLL